VSSEQLNKFVVISVKFTLDKGHYISAVGNLSQTFFSNVSSSIESIIKSRTTKKMWEKYSYDSDKCDRQKKIMAINQIVVDKMNFAYDENYIIKDFSVVFERGKKYALLGESGSGKTTFAKVLAGLLDNYSGNVFFDKIELKEIQRHSLFNQITYVDQNVYVFAESIRFNISLGENFSDEEIWEALRKSQLDEFVNSLDGKLEYKLSENGKNLSGGQRQRLALARAFIRNVSFVIIDEGTSALDMKNAMEIENTLMAEPDTGMIIISHSLSEETKKKLDNVISFEEINCV
jgi:ATP-binding cassette subfamily B protein